MYKEARKPVDSDIISIDIKNRNAQFKYLSEPTFNDFFSQALLMMLLPILLMVYLGFFIALFIEIINSYLLGDIFFLFTPYYNPLSTDFFAALILSCMLFTIYIAFVDYFFKTKTISALHKSIYLFSEKHNITPTLNKRDYIFVKAKQQIETIRIPSPSVGFFWDSSKEHRKYLDKIVFYHENVCKFPRKTKTWFPNGFKTGLAFYKRPEAMLKLYFSKLPNTGRLKFTVY